MFRNHPVLIVSIFLLLSQQLQASYNSYTWPAAPVLAWYLWEHRRRELTGKRVLEIGAGTSLPGIVAAKCGAIVTLSDSATQPKSLQHIQRCCEANGVQGQVRILGLTWGLFLQTVFSVGPVDYILGSDCFFEPALFEDIIVTVAYLLEKNPHAKFLCTYDDRNGDWSIEHLLHKWHLHCEHISLKELAEAAGIDVNELTQNRTILLFEISRNDL